MIDGAVLCGIVVGGLLAPVLGNAAIAVGFFGDGAIGVLATNRINHGGVQPHRVTASDRIVAVTFALLGVGSIAVVL